MSTYKAKLSNSHEVLINYVSGVCGGVAVVLIGHPFDTTKTRLQVILRFYDLSDWYLTFL